MENIKIDPIYECRDGTYIDLSKIISIGRSFGPNEDRRLPSSTHVVEVICQLHKEPIRVVLLGPRTRYGNIDYLEFIENERNALVSAWKSYKKQNI